jgi:hypothetical protein
MVNLDSSASMTFDGLLAVVWNVRMVADVDQPPRLQNIIPGCLYTFMFAQAAKPRVFTWPVNCRNAGQIDMTPGSITTQNFIGLDIHTLIAVPAAGTWTET